MQPTEKSTISTEEHHRLVKLLPGLLARLGIVDAGRGAEVFGLAWPLILTGGLRVALRLIDFLMVGIAAGAVGVAALGFSYQFFFLGFATALAISSGTISLVSQHWGAEETDQANFVIKQSTWIALLLSVPITAISFVWAEELISLLGAAPDVVEVGGAYLRVLMVGLVFRFFSMIASRGFAGAGNTKTPMYVRSVGVPCNVVLNLFLIFGIWRFPELGVVGAAVGTTLTNFSLAAVFFFLLVSNKYEVTFPIRGKHWDQQVVRKLFRVSLPLLAMRMARVLGRFPFLWVLAQFGTGMVAAYQVAQRVELFAMEPAWGLGTAASTLVGQSLGGHDEILAEKYGWDTLKLAFSVMVPIGFLIAALAEPISSLFAEQAEVISLSVSFIWVNAFGVLGFALNRIMRGGLRGAGDTRWPFYGNLLGMYGWMLPVAYFFGIVLDFGPGAIYAAIVGFFFIPGIVNYLRFKSGEWKRVSREITGTKQV